MINSNNKNDSLTLTCPDFPISYAAKGCLSVALPTAEGHSSARYATLNTYLNGSKATDLGLTIPSTCRDHQLLCIADGVQASFIEVLYGDANTAAEYLQQHPSRGLVATKIPDQTLGGSIYVYLVFATAQAAEMFIALCGIEARAASRDSGGPDGPRQRVASLTTLITRTSPRARGSLTSWVLRSYLGDGLISHCGSWSATIRDEHICVLTASGLSADFAKELASVSGVLIALYMRNQGLLSADVINSSTAIVISDGNEDVLYEALSDTFSNVLSAPISDEIVPLFTEMQTLVHGSGEGAITTTGSGPITKSDLLDVAGGGFAVTAVSTAIPSGGEARNDVEVEPWHIVSDYRYYSPSVSLSGYPRLAELGAAIPALFFIRPYDATVSTTSQHEYEIQAQSSQWNASARDRGPSYGVTLRHSHQVTHADGITTTQTLAVESVVGNANTMDFARSAFAHSVVDSLNSCILSYVTGAMGQAQVIRIGDTDEYVAFLPKIEIPISMIYGDQVTAIQVATVPGSAVLFRYNADEHVAELLPLFGEGLAHARTVLPLLDREDDGLDIVALTVTIAHAGTTIRRSGSFRVDQWLELALQDIQQYERAAVEAVHASQSDVSSGTPMINLTGDASDRGGFNWIWLLLLLMLMSSDDDDDKSAVVNVNQGTGQSGKSNPSNTDDAAVSESTSIDEQQPPIDYREI